MIPIVKKDPPEVTEELKAAIRSRIQFTVPNIDASGWHSSHRHTFLVQCDGTLVALYDKKADHWFVNENQSYPTVAWTAKLVLEAVGEVTLVPYKMLRGIQHKGILNVVRKRLNVAKEK